MKQFFLLAAFAFIAFSLQGLPVYIHFLPSALFSKLLNDTNILSAKLDAKRLVTPKFEFCSCIQHF